MERAKRREGIGTAKTRRSPISPNSKRPNLAPAFTATAAEEPNNAEKASARTTRRSALLSGGSKEAKTPKQLCAAVAAAAKPTPARGLGAMGTTTPVAPSVAATPASTSSRGGAAASGGILTPRKRPLLQLSTVITLSAAAAAVPGAPRAPATSATSAAAAAAPAPSSAAAAAAPLLPSTTATTATARAAALVSGLPEPHASLAAAFAALHSAAALVRGRGGQRLTFEGTGGCGNGVGGGNRGGNNPNSARAAVERATGRRFSVSHVLQIRALYPEGVALEYVNAPGSVAAAPGTGGGGGGGGAGASLPPMLLAIRVTDPAAGSAREEFARRLRGACEAAARRAAREAEGRCRSPAASGCRKSRGGTRARRGEEDEEREEDEEEEAVRARAAAAAAVTAAPGLLLRLPEAPLPPLPPGRVAATPHFGPSASAAEEKEENGEEGKQEPAAAASAAPPTSFPRPPLAPSSSALASRARQRLTFGDAGGAAAVGARAAALSDAEVLRASLPAALAREAIEGLGATAEGGGSAARGLADLPMSAVRAAHAAQARRDAVADPERAEARARSALLALLPRAFDCARAAFGGSGSGGSSASGLGSLRIPGGRPPTPAPCVKPLSLVHDALSRAVLGSASGGGGAPAGGGSSSTAAAPSLALALDAPALARELAAAAPEVFSIGEPRLGREAEGPVLRINRAADAGAARARLVAAAAADRASNAA